MRRTGLVMGRIQFAVRDGESDEVVARLARYLFADSGSVSYGELLAADTALAEENRLSREAAVADAEPAPLLATTKRSGCWPRLRKRESGPGLSPSIALASSAWGGPRSIGLFPLARRASTPSGGSPRPVGGRYSATAHPLSPPRPRLRRASHGAYFR
jgi:hypothetical protein